MTLEELKQYALQGGLLAGSFAPGAGIADAAGVYPNAEGGFDPSLRENFKQGNYFTSALQGLGALGDASYAIPAVGPFVGATVGSALKAPREMQKAAKAAETAAKITKKQQTVMNPQRIAFPDIYKDPRELVAEAASRVAPEDPMMQRLFGVTRDDLFQMAQEGTRQGNMTERPFKAAEKSRGSAIAENVMNPRNVRRLQNIIEVSKEYPDLYKGMAAWYVNDPLYQWYAREYGPEMGARMFNQMNALTGMASPGSEVLTEINRGTAANWLANQGRFGDFMKYAGQAVDERGKNFPADMQAIMGHAYHKTAQGLPMKNYLDSGGLLTMGSAKVPSYIHASGVPEVGFQTRWPVGDAHWSRLVGLPDVRNRTFEKGKEVLPAKSASVPEMVSLGPWWQNKVAAPMGLEGVPAQAVVWGAGSGATGVTSPIGAPKLELMATQIGKAANRMGVSPETARDLILSGKAHAGFVGPGMLPWLAAAGGGGLLGQWMMNGDEQ